MPVNAATGILANSRSPRRGTIYVNRASAPNNVVCPGDGDEGDEKEDFAAFRAKGQKHRNIIGRVSEVVEIGRRRNLRVS
ncbi:hypothetical protein [Paracoccus yeei]|uniref:hypothetical protein n=1 Tax=Paracoccus yeei TaxID=147645 RepID=UPI0011B07502|nr:hypothetical protein [Paracoccus yeei]